MFAIFETGGKQYKAFVGDVVEIEKISVSEGDVFFDKVLARGEGSDIKIGTPYINGAVVSGKVLGEKRDKKKIVFHFKSKTRRRTLKGHRQTHALVSITNV